MPLRTTKLFEPFGRYTPQRLSQVYRDSPAFLPLLVNVGIGEKVVILNAGLEKYLDMFLKGAAGAGLKATLAPYPLEEKQGGFNKQNEMVTQRAGYTTRAQGTRSFLWRIVYIKT